MRLVLKTINNHTLMSDRSPDGLPRFVVVSKDGTVRIFNALRYTHAEVEQIIWKLS